MSDPTQENPHGHLREGGCACGAIRFRVTRPFIAIGACHCTDCQKGSGGGPNHVALVPRDGLELMSGTPAQYRSVGSSGAEVARLFCGDCGTPLWSLPAHEPFLPVKVGALDERADLVPVMHVFTASAPPWHVIPEGRACFAAMPPRS